MPDEKPDHHRAFKRPHLPSLHIGVRIVLLGIGWVVLALGFAGLLLPTTFYVVRVVMCLLVRANIDRLVIQR